MFDGISSALEFSDLQKWDRRGFDMAHRLTLDSKTNVRGT